MGQVTSVRPELKSLLFGLFVVLKMVKVKGCASQGGDRYYGLFDILFTVQSPLHSVLRGLVASVI